MQSSKEKPCSRLLVAVIVVVFGVSVGARASADVGLRVGPRIGLERHDDSDLLIGGDVRLSFPLSPLTINPSFDYYFDEERTLFQVSVNALYYLPWPAHLFDPYVGVGVGVNTFSYPSDAAVADGHGSRLGMNLIGGVCFDVPWVAPFVQAMASIGEIDLITLGGGFLFGSGSRDKPDWDACGRRSRGGVEGRPR